MPDSNNPSDNLSDAPEIYATVPISQAVVVPETEDVYMGGFAWSAEFGLLIAAGDQGGLSRDVLEDLRRDEESLTLLNQDQGLRGLDG